jgi:ribonuclease Z
VISDRSAETTGVVRIVVLGTGSPIPEPGRGGSAVAIVGESDWVLVDCGRAATQRVIDAGLDLSTVVAVGITHHHSDHVSDIVTFATARWTAGASTPLTVLAPTGPAARYAEHCLDPFDDQSFHTQAPVTAGPRPAVAVRGFDAPARLEAVFSSGPWSIASVLVDHRPVEPAVGYLIEIAGRRVAISGDTAVCDGMYQLAMGVDVLVHQALLSSRVSADLLTWNASARSVGELAARARPKTLVLTHLIPAPRSQTDDLEYIDEVRAGGFDGHVLVARDLLHVETNI